MFDAVSRLGIVNDNVGLEYYIPADFQKPPEYYGIKSPYVALVSGGSYYTKQIPSEIIHKIIQKFPEKMFVLLGDKSDFERTKTIHSENTLNLCGKLHFHESADIIKNAESVITSDTGLMHVASAFKKKIFSFWGNTIPEFGMYPYLPGEGSCCFEVNDLSCRPCSKLGFNKCPQKHFNCMLGQNVKNLKL
jgi:ADP-heptose:LPS heptosyltransferase